MVDKKIEVITYSGYRGEETPRAFILHNEKIEITGILDMWIEEGLRDRSRKRFFKVRGNDKFTYKLYFDEKTREWFVCKN